ncbi:MAG: 3,5-cyclic-AMP phosphodiesterase, partial [Actinomycetota bacterium]|nr:3,5-cyclic-AMP phosphodiesterase [Actinomycetota bacterium]
RSRSEVYGMWAREESRYEASAARSAERAALVAVTLDEIGHSTDEDVVPEHTRWITNLIGERAGDVALGPMFLARLGDWVEGHGGGFFGERAARIAELGSQERDAVRFPSELPGSPPFERLHTPELDAPGEVKFTFGILADMHIGSPSARRMVEAAIDDLNRSGAEFVIQLGDITDHGAKEEFGRAAEVLSKLEIPYWTMMGNHDVYSIPEERLSGREYFKETFGRDPDGVLFDHDGVKFAVLDSVEHAASPFPPYNLVTGAFVEGPGGAIVCGALSYPQHDLLAEIAGPGGGPAFVFLHHPPQPFTGFPPILFGLREEDAGRLHAVVDSGNVWGVFAGHTHRNALTRTYGTVPAIEVGIPRDYPYGYALVDVTESGYRYRFVQLSDDDLLRHAYEHASAIHRRYGGGRAEERAFSWTAP